MTSTVRKAVFPAAGLGTRFLPATKAQPKEMLPLVDKPIIQYGVEEAVGSGVDHIILVTGRGKNAIEDHFDVSIELETFLESRGKKDQLDEIRKISSLISVAYVRQGEPLGLGHAVLVTRDLVGNEPFAVILADDVIDAQPPALAQMISVYEEVQGPVILVERVPRDPTAELDVYRRYFAERKVDGELVSGLLARVRTWRAQRVQVIGIRSPSSAEMLELEDEMSGFDERALAREFEAAGGRWITLADAAWPTQDGGHLTPEAARAFTRELSPRLAAVRSVAPVASRGPDF